MNAVNSGSFVWTINDRKLIKQILNAKIGDEFESKEFEIANLKWKIQIVPNGENEYEQNQFLLYLKCLSIPLIIDKMFICLALQFKETNTKNVAPVEYNHDKDRRCWPV